MKRTLELLRTGRFAAAIFLAVATVTAESSVAQETSAGDEKSSNTKPINDDLQRRDIPPGIVVLESGTKRLIGLVVWMSDSRSWVAVSTREFHNRFGDIEEIELTDGKSRHLAKRVHDDELRSISFFQVDKQLTRQAFTQRTGALPKGSKLECLTTAGEGRMLTSHAVTVTHPRTTLDSKPVDYFRVEPDIAGASCVLYHEGSVVGLGISQTRSDPSDETNLATEVLPMSTLLVAVEAHRQIENTKPLVHLLEKLYPKLRLEVHPVGGAVLLRGTVESVEIRRQLIEIAEQFFPKVLEQLRVQPAARSAVELSKTDADQIVQIGDDRQGIRARLRTLFPNAKLEINFANDAVILRGRVARSEDIKPIIHVAEQYFSKVLDYIVADDGPPGAGRPWQSANPEYPEILTQGVRTNRVAAVVERLKAEFGNRITIETKKLSEDASTVTVAGPVGIAHHVGPLIHQVDESVSDSRTPRPTLDGQDAGLDVAAKQLALRVRATREPERSKLRAELQALTEKHFEQRQQRRDKDIAELADRVEKLRVAHHRRQENKADIIKRRLAELLDEDKDLKWDEASARRGAGEPTTARPAAGLPMPVLNEEATPKRLDAEKTSSPEDGNKTATAALVRAAEARQKLAEYELTKAEESNKKVPGAFPSLDIERFKTNLEIANAELDAAKEGVDISRTNKPRHDNNSEPTYNNVALSEWLRRLEVERNPEKLAEAVLAMNSLASDAEPRQLVRATLRMMQAYVTQQWDLTNSTIFYGSVGLLCLAKSDVVVEELIAELDAAPTKKLSLQFRLVLAELFRSLVRQPDGLLFASNLPVPRVSKDAVQSLRIGLRRNSSRLVTALAAAEQRDPALSDWLVGCTPDLLSLGEQPLMAHSDLMPLVERVFADAKSNHQHAAARLLGSNNVRVPEVLALAESWLSSNAGRSLPSSDGGFRSASAVEAASDLLATIGPHSPQAVTRLTEILRDRWARFAEFSAKPVTKSAKSQFDLPDGAILIEALGRIGEPAHEAIPLLREIEQSPASEAELSDMIRVVVSGSSRSLERIPKTLRALVTATIQQIENVKAKPNSDSRTDEK